MLIVSADDGCLRFIGRSSSKKFEIKSLINCELNLQEINNEN